MQFVWSTTDLSTMWSNNCMTKLWEMKQDM